VRFFHRVQADRVGFPYTAPSELSDPRNRQKLLADLRAYVESVAAEQIVWYKKSRVSRQIASLWIRFCSLLFLFLGGLCPLLPRDLPRSPVQDFEPWGYLLIGIGGGLLLFDRLFGISSSWMRFIWASFEIEALLDDFRISWLKILLEDKESDSLEALQPFLATADNTIKRIHAIVLQETSSWRTEFQTNIAHQMSLGKSHSGDQISSEVIRSKEKHPGVVRKSD